MKETYCVVTFHVTQHALIFENLMIENGIETKLMPTPRQVSTSCGTSARIPCTLKSQILELCTAANIPIDEFHEINSKKENNWFSKYINK